MVYLYRDGSNPRPLLTMVSAAPPPENFAIFTNDELEETNNALPVSKAIPIIEQWIQMMDASADADLKKIADKLTQLKGVLNSEPIAVDAYDVLVNTIVPLLTSYENNLPADSGTTVARPRKQLSKLSGVVAAIQIR